MITCERWVDLNINSIKNYYQISNCGRVKNKYTGRILKNQKDKAGYLKVPLSIKSLKKKNKLFFIHRLVALSFIENNDLKNKNSVNHIDYNKENNKVTNLEWMSIRDNILDMYKNKPRKTLRGEENGSNKYKESLIRKVCEYLESDKTPKEIFEKTGVPQNLIGLIKSKKCWTHISKEYKIPNPKKRNKYEKYYKSIDELVSKKYNFKEIRSILKLPVNKSIRELIRRRIKIFEKFNDYRNDGCLKIILGKSE